MATLFSNKTPPSNPEPGLHGVTNLWGLLGVDDSTLADGYEICVTAEYPALMRLEKSNSSPESIPDGIVVPQSGVGRWVWVRWIEVS